METNIDLIELRWGWLLHIVVGIVTWAVLLAGALAFHRGRRTSAVRFLIAGAAVGLGAAVLSATITACHYFSIFGHEESFDMMKWARLERWSGYLWLAGNLMFGLAFFVVASTTSATPQGLDSRD